MDIRSNPLLFLLLVMSPHICTTTEEGMKHDKIASARDAKNGTKGTKTDKADVNNLLNFFDKTDSDNATTRTADNGTNCDNGPFDADCNPYAAIDEMNSTLVPMFPYHIHYPADSLFSVDGHPCQFGPCIPQNGIQQHVHHGNDHPHFYGNMMFPESQNHLVSHNPCSNNGLYIPNGPNHRTCLCLVGFRGSACKAIDYCKMDYCKNNQTCSLTGSAPGYRCWCSKKFYGEQCENTNPCSDNPCENHGHCSHDGKGAVSCVCQKGFRGNKCQEINSCVPNPCANGGTCTATAEPNGKNAKFTCACTEWFKGSNCESPRLCASFPCHNGGTCQETDKDFTCQCPDGFVGKYCTDFPCNPSPCFHGATCIEIGSDYQCLCPSWAKGRNCSVVNPCYSNPCRFGGQCIDVTSGYNWLFKHMQYYCLCKPPHMGPHCTDNICNYCSVNALCDNSSKCICDKGFFGNGYTCEPEEPDPCHPNPCQSGGACVSQPNNEFFCNCTEPFKPPLCLEKVPCDPDPCKNGQCIPNRDGTYMCGCFPGYTGKHCNVSSPCDPNPCLHGGECVISNEKTMKWECKCPYPRVYRGNLCHECNCPASPDPAERPGTHCDPRLNQCFCNENFNASKWEFDVSEQECVIKSPPTIDDEKDKVSIEKVRHDIVVIVVKANKIDGGSPLSNSSPYDPPNATNNKDNSTGKDESGMWGTAPIDALLISNSSSSDPPTATDDENKSANESAPLPPSPSLDVPSNSSTSPPNIPTPSSDPSKVPDDKGKDDKDKDDKDKDGEAPPPPPPSADAPPPPPSGKSDKCQPDNPCKNGGRCILMAGNPGFRCICKEWWIGPVCSTRRACVPDNPCLNGATCKEDGKGGYSCECPDGYSGRLCEIQGRTSICFPNPCKNGGVCHDLGGKYDCECLLRYTGPHCQIDKCANCDPNALCIGGKCKCRNGWTGNGYECIKEEETEHDEDDTEEVEDNAPSCNCGELQSCACIGCPCECNPGTEAVYPNGVTTSKICVPLSALMPDTFPTAMTYVQTEPTLKPTPKLIESVAPLKNDLTPKEGHTTPKPRPLTTTTTTTKKLQSEVKQRSLCPSLSPDCQPNDKDGQTTSKDSIKEISREREKEKEKEKESSSMNEFRAELENVLGNPRPKDVSFDMLLPTHRRSYFRRPSDSVSLHRKSIRRMRIFDEQRRKA